MRPSALLPFGLVLSLCLPAALAPTAAALPTPGLFCEASLTATGRLFPEAMEANDFVSYDEALCGIEWLLKNHPDRVKRDVVGQSVGWDALGGGRETFDVFVVRVSDYASAIPVEEKDRIVFQLSIHGNEKGGREGGLRVIEDFARGIGFAEEFPGLLDLLQRQELLFVFPNPDGWTHEEVQYRHNDACYLSVTCPDLTKPGEPGVEGQNFVRVNGNGVDVNREWPTIGWVRAAYTPMSEPEAIGLVDYLKRETNVRYASDLHGMLNPADGKAPAVDCGLGAAFDPTGLDPTCFAHAADGAPGHYILTMLPAGRQEPRELSLTTSLAQRVKDVLNNDPYFAEWQSAPETEQGLWGGEFNDWGTVWDTLGYTDSGFTSDFYAQDHGLDAPGVDFEFSYNHITFDNYYPGVAQRMNAYHVQATRDIVRAFMEHAAETPGFQLDAKGTRTAWVEATTLVTNEGRMRVSGWAEQNPADDLYDGAHRVYRATPDDFFLDRKALLGNGALDPVRRVGPGAFDGYDHVIVAGSAYRRFADDERAREALRQFAEQGGTVLLTDEALQLLPTFGLAEADAVKVNFTYAGHTNFVDKEHALVKDVRGLARQTYEPVPLGYNLSARDAPVWHVNKSGLSKDVEVVGVAGEGQGAEPNPFWVNFGQAKVGEGRVVFLGAMLPDPRDADAAYYGVDSYATTYTTEQLLRNVLGWEAVASDDPLAAAGGADGASDSSIPGPGLALLALAAVGAAMLLRRRRG